MYQQKDDLFFSWYVLIFCIFIIFQTNCGMYIWTGDRKSYTIHILHGCLEFYCVQSSENMHGGQNRWSTKAHSSPDFMPWNLSNSQIMKKNVWCFALKIISFRPTPLLENMYISNFGTGYDVPKTKVSLIVISDSFSYF